MRREATQGESGERSLLAAHLPAIYPRDHRLPDEPSPLSTRTPETPLYDSLTTNLPLPVMTFTSQNAAPGAWLFPHHQEVNKYLHDYEQRFDLKKFITFNTLVSRAIWDRETKLWELSLQKSGEPSSQSLEYFDHLLVCNGHYAKPYSPDFEGLGLWAAHESRSVIHSMWYREPSPYQDLRVLVIGGGPSGNDISSDISEVAKETIQSVRSFQDGQAGRITQRGAIDRFTEDGSVIFKSGKQAYVDRVVLATGYKYDFPFLPQLPLRPPEPNSTALYNSGLHLYPLSQHLFPLMSPFPPSSLAFFGLPSKVAPFPLFEAQALLAARVMTGRVRIDFGKEYRIAALRNSKLLEASGYSAERAAKAWHVLDTPEAQFGYREHLWRLAGEPDKTVPAWTCELYDKKFVIRDGWRELVKRGEADSWAKSVETGDTDEWVEFAYKVLRETERKGEQSELPDSLNQSERTL
ncbi:flavin-containing monooxygenase/FMO family protein [Ceratobasidium sp. AG-Ba]|nr:flavin-containing monooxygenase/FMO family protein [Ceratobasidium sp. AG-Ba]